MAELSSTDRQNKLYPLPLASDSAEGGRLDEQHEILKLVLSGLYPCPELVADVLKPSSDGQAKSVLDLGSGSGAWCLDVAREFPYAQVIGIDISSNLHQSNVPNCRCEVWDINRGLSPYYGQFDLVHMRLIHGLVDHHASTLEAVKCLKPGGLILYLRAGSSVTEDRMRLWPAFSSRTPDGSWFQRFWCFTELGATLRGIRTDLYRRDYEDGFWDYDGIDPDTCGGAFITTPIGPWVTTSDPVETARLREIGAFWKRNFSKLHWLLANDVATSGRTSKDMEVLHKRLDAELETERSQGHLVIRAIWGRASAIGSSVAREEEQARHQDTSSPSLSNESGYQVMTRYNSKVAWTKFNTDLQSTMTSDTKQLMDIPGFDLIEER